LKFKFDRIYSKIIATREYTWALSSRVLGDNDIDPGTSNVNIDGVDFEEGNKDSEEDGISNLENDMS
jgi:hypothetical protein